MFVLHSLLRPDAVEARDYQVNLARLATQTPSLLVLPTGLGKTIIALLAVVEFLERFAQQRVLLLAPTKPLVEQHAATFRQLLAGIPVAAFTGETGPAQRDEAWAKNRVIVATPQILEHDLVRGARDLRDVCCVVFDEAHRATGAYPYVFIARRFREAGGRHAIGLTASPGSDLARIQAVLHNLGLSRIEVRTERDPDIQPYVHPVATEWVRVKPTPTLMRIIHLLTRGYHRAVNQLRRLGYVPWTRGLPGRTELLEVGRRIRVEASAPHARRGVFEAATAQARALKIQHALELAETQGLSFLQHFLARVQAEAEQAGGSRAARDFTKEPEFSEALTLAREAAEPHPKVPRVVQLVREQLAAGARRLLVFTNYRETADLVVASLQPVPGCLPHRFVGHATASGEKGLAKRAQQEVVARFRRGELNVLVATSVAEEGLDLPETDAVILYEPVPSGIRMIQRRGRTGRRAQGRVFVLVTEGTRDETYYWSALRREKRMHEELMFLRQAATRQTLLPPASDPTPPVPPQPPLGRVEILVDAREASGSVPRLLLERGALVKTASLPVGDYAPSDRIRVERKTAADFVASLKDGRLFGQARRLSESGAGVLLVEGDVAEITAHVTPASYLGALGSLVSDHGLTVLTVPDASATAEFLLSLARRERAEGRSAPAAQRFVKRAASGREELRFLLEGVPGIGPVLADRILDRFGTVAAVASATVEQLRQVEGVGADRARTIREVLHRSYREPGSAGTASEAAGAGVLTFQAGDGAAREQGAQPEAAQVGAAGQPLARRAEPGPGHAKDSVVAVVSGQPEVEVGGHRGSKPAQEFGSVGALPLPLDPEKQVPVARPA